MSSGAENSLTSFGDDSSAAESDGNLSARVFKSEKTRKKYAKFIGIQEIRKQPKSTKKRKADHDDNSNEPESEGTTEIVHFKCLTCLRICTTSLSSTGNIARHLKVRKYYWAWAHVNKNDLQSF